MVIITPLLAMQIAGFATKIGAVALKESNPQVAKNLALLSKFVDVGTQTAGKIAKASASPNIEQTPTPTEGSGLQINPPINNEGVQQGIFNRPRNILGIPGQENSMYNIFGA